MADPILLPTPSTPLPFEAELAPLFAGFVRIAVYAAKSAQPGNKDITFQRVLEGLIRSWREETRFMRRMRAFSVPPLSATSTPPAADPTN